MAIDRACAIPSDCVLVDHADCCGTIRVGVRAGTQASARAAEASYAACFDCGARGCAHADQSEDGATPNVGQSIAGDVQREPLHQHRPVTIWSIEGDL